MLILSDLLACSHVVYLFWLPQQVPVHDVARPSTEKRVKGEGMPLSKSPGSKGDLRIRFDVQFPRALTEQQKAGLRQLLPSG
jgi:DnaJ family protein B protein 4